MKREDGERGREREREREREGEREKERKSVEEEEWNRERKGGITSQFVVDS